MGYTHYWTKKETTLEKFKEFSNVCKTLTDNIDGDDVVICGGDGTGKPKFNSKYVSFNGNSREGLDHETFYIESSLGDGNWGFCKTDRKPYDLLVCACLIGAHSILGYEITSDGDLSDGWDDAIRFYNDVIGETDFTI